IASSITCCTVTPFGCSCQPRYCVPSYCTTSLRVRTSPVLELEQERGARFHVPEVEALHVVAVGIRAARDFEIQERVVHAPPRVEVVRAGRLEPVEEDLRAREHLHA